MAQQQQEVEVPVFKKGLVLGMFQGDNDSVILTRAAHGFQQLEEVTQDLKDLINCSGLAKKQGDCRVFYGLHPSFPAVATVNLGRKDATYNEQEELDEARENVRVAVGAGVKTLQDNKFSVVFVDPCGEPEAAAEAAYLVTFSYDELKAEENRKTAVKLFCYSTHHEHKDGVEEKWNRGVTTAEGQNLARYLMEAPANVMTPERFCAEATEKLGSLANVTINIREKAWVEARAMGAFLGVNQGSDVPLRFLEISYTGGTEGDAPLALVGKGITFDSGGISIKPSSHMEDMRADMGGAACVLGALYAVAKLALPINVMLFTPLTDNMPSGKATHPGDVHTCMSGKTIQVDNTDAEGRLVLSDALTYAQEFNPRGIIDMATLTGAMITSLGAAATGCFTNSTTYWNLMHEAGKQTGDRAWRMPVFKLYSSQMTDCHLADVDNLGTKEGSAGGSCTAAAFLKEFVTNENWLHMDTAGVMSNSNEVSYLRPGMSGRPTRTVVEFIQRLSDSDSANRKK